MRQGPSNTVDKLRAPGARRRAGTRSAPPPCPVGPKRGRSTASSACSTAVQQNMSHASNASPLTTHPPQHSRVLPFSQIATHERLELPQESFRLRVGCTKGHASGVRTVQCQQLTAETQVPVHLVSTKSSDTLDNFATMCIH